VGYKSYPVQSGSLRFITVFRVFHNWSYTEPCDSTVELSFIAM
jgi:hypothetical protein